MSIYEDLEKALDESFSYTLHDKLIFISGYLDGDLENEDLLNFVNYLLYSEKENMSFPLLSSTSPKLDTNSIFPIFDKKFNSKCKKCKYYKSDVLLRCTGCTYFNFTTTSQDLFEEDINAE